MSKGVSVASSIENLGRRTGGYGVFARSPWSSPSSILVFASSGAAVVTECVVFVVGSADVVSWEISVVVEDVAGGMGCRVSSCCTAGGER